MPVPPATEGYVPFREYRTWYQVVGEIPGSFLDAVEAGKHR